MVKTHSLHAKNLRFGERWCNLLAILVLVSCFCFIFTYDDAWLDRAQTIFHFPLLLLWVLFFYRHPSLLVISLTAVASCVFTYFGLIDEVLYSYLSEGGWLRALAGENGFVNPQYIKLFLYFITLGIFTIRLAFFKWRSEERVFSWIGAVACLGVTLILHMAIPASILKWQRNHELQSTENILSLLIKEGSTSEKCELFHLQCHMHLSREDVSHWAQGAERSRDPYVLRKWQQMQATQRNTFSFEHGYFLDSEWRRQVFSIQKDGDGYSIAVGEEIINRIQKLNEEQFGFLAFWAHLVWGWLFVFLGLFHKSKRKNFLYSKSL